jgi:hypothetical protein
LGVAYWSEIGLDSPVDSICQDGVSSVSVQCAYTHTTDYTATLVICLVLWILLIVSHTLLNCKYQTNDLRYYLAVEKNKNHAAIRYPALAVLFGTVMLIIYAFVEIAYQLRDGLAIQLATQLTLTTLLTALVNYQKLLPLVSSHFFDLDGVDIETSFTDPIPIKMLVQPGLANGYGIMQSPENVFSVISDAIEKCYKYGNKEALNNIVDVEDENDEKTIAQLVTKVESVMEALTTSSSL